ncbi:MAG: glycosyltransferase [Duncaniella sp.]|nr:glycosyltransferase [Duncaniella sp.]
MSVSIIIPVYNATSCVERALRSVVNQTFTGQMECIVVNDGSTDNSASLVREFIGAYRGPIDFRFVELERNKGLSEARNEGMRHAGNDYLLFVDADDALDFRALELLVAQTERHPGVDVVVGAYYLARQHLFLQLETGGTDYVADPSEARALWLSPRRVPMTAHNKLFRRGFVTGNSLEFTPGIYHEDELWTFQCGAFISSVAFVYEPTYVYFVSAGSITSTSNSKRLADLEYVVQTEISTVVSRPNLPQVKFAIGNLIDLDSHLHHSPEWSSDRQALTARLRGYVEQLRAAAVKAGAPLRLRLALRLLGLELTLRLSPPSRLFWLVHRAAKMFSL